MKILSVHKGQDTGGQGWRMTDAFRRLVPDWEFRSAYAPNSFFYLDYPRDIDPWDGLVVARLWKDADVVHLHNNFRTADILERANGVRHYSYAKVNRKQAVIHYHGTTFRAQPQAHLAQQKQRKATGIVSTLDLWLLAPNDTEWLPAPYNLDWLKTFRKPDNGESQSPTGVSSELARPNRSRTALGPSNDAPHGATHSEIRAKHSTRGVVRVAHAPTERGVKDTDAFLAAVERLQGEGHQIEVDLIEGVKWMECLERKGKADIYYDQVLLGYGCNAIEAWGMGIPVIAGGQPDTLAEMERRFGELPFYNATKDTIYDALLALMDSDVRKEYAKRGTAHVRKYHDEAKVVEQLQDVYRRAAA